MHPNWSCCMVEWAFSVWEVAGCQDLSSLATVEASQEMMRWQSAILDAEVTVSADNSGTAGTYVNEVLRHASMGSMMNNGRCAPGFQYYRILLLTYYVQ